MTARVENTDAVRDQIARATDRPIHDNTDKTMTTIANLSRIFQDADDHSSHIGRRLMSMVNGAVRSEIPPFPRQLQIETSNICNHKCTFCAYTQMDRPSQHMNRELFRRLVSEAYALGAREIGLFAGSEPLTCKWLYEYVELCRQIGYEYQYISTNGALGDPDTFRRLLDSGLSSIKFSINAGTRESYKTIHGRDDFDKVLKNVRAVSEHRKTLETKVYLGVSFVGMPDTSGEFEMLSELLGSYVDEVLFYEAYDQNGKISGLGPVPFSECALPFNKLHISVEGYIKACCNDYDNLMAIDDITELGLSAAWGSDRFRKLRRQHLDDTLDGTLCGKCIRNCGGRVDPLNESLLSDPVRANLARSA